jgi:hypothetical protein
MAGRGVMNEASSSSMFLQLLMQTSYHAGFTR